MIKYNSDFESCLKRCSGLSVKNSPFSTGLAILRSIVLKSKRAERISEWLVKGLPLAFGLILFPFLFSLLGIPVPEIVSYFQPAVFLVVFALMAVALADVCIRTYKAHAYSRLVTALDEGTAAFAEGRIDASTVRSVETESGRSALKVSGYLKPNGLTAIDFLIDKEVYHNRFEGLSPGDLYCFSKTVSGWSDFLLVTDMKTVVLCGYTKNGTCWISTGDMCYTRKSKQN